jgi:hypothetical protein
MAYMSQEHKARISQALKAIDALQPFKWSLRVRHHSTIVMTIRSGPLDLIGNFNETCRDYRTYGEPFKPVKDYLDVNPYHYRDTFTGESLDLVDAVLKALNLDNYNRSDIQTDYFNVGHYVDLNIGEWDKPYTVTAAARLAA